MNFIVEPEILSITSCIACKPTFFKRKQYLLYTKSTMMSNEEILAIIQAKREERYQNKSDDSKRKSQSLSGASLKKYSSVLRSLYTALKKNSNDPLTAQFFSNHKDKVIELLFKKTNVFFPVFPTSTCTTITAKDRSNWKNHGRHTSDTTDAMPQW